MKYSDIGTRCIALYASNNSVNYIDSFAVEHFLRGINSFINKLTIVRNIFRKQASDSIMCGYFCIAFIDFMLARKTLTNFTNIFSPNNFKKMMIWF